MAIDFKEKFATLVVKDIEPLTQEELGYIKQVEDYIDSQIEVKLSTNNIEVWIDKRYVEFYHNPLTKKNFTTMSSARKRVLKVELLKRYENANWKLDWYGDYLILRGKK